MCLIKRDPDEIEAAKKVKRKAAKERRAARQYEQAMAQLDKDRA